MQYRHGTEAKSLWNEQDGFYYDAISWGGGWAHQMPVRSLVGLIPMYATLTLEQDVVNRFPQFKKHVEWIVKNKSDLTSTSKALDASASELDSSLNDAALDADLDALL